MAATRALHKPVGDVMHTQSIILEPSHLSRSPLWLSGLDICYIIVSAGIGFSPNVNLM